MNKHGLSFGKVLVSLVCATLSAASWAHNGVYIIATLDEYPSGAPIIPPKPKAHDNGDAGLDEYPTGSPVIPPKPKANIQY